VHQIFETVRVQTVKDRGAPLDEQQRRNSFDAIRLIAAFGVFYGHQLLIAGGSDTVIGPIGIASLSLYAFFALSGYLIHQSLVRDSSLQRYARARVLRIWPAFVVNLWFCVAVGAAITVLPLAEFLSAGATLRYIGINLTIVMTPTQFFLPGVFENQVWRPINGSIWTIKYEILAYVAAFLLYRLGGRSHQQKLLGVLVALLVVNYVLCFKVFGPRFPAAVFGRDGLAFFAEYNYYNVSRFFLAFFFGALLAACEPLSVRLRLVLMAAIIGVIAVFHGTDFERLGTILLLCLIVVELGKSRLLWSAVHRRLGDVSYGFFLYAYPIQNYIWSYHSADRDFHAVTFIAAILIFACALLSWHFVERPMLARKPRPQSKLAEST
jgi:peptidoglycan/LPS O-acetylase OafA/YrhL